MRHERFTLKLDKLNNVLIFREVAKIRVNISKYIDDMDPYMDWAMKRCGAGLLRYTFDLGSVPFLIS